MIVLHAGWFENILWLWGEQSTDQEDSKSTKKAITKSKTVNKYPFDAGIKQIIETLKASSYPGKVVKKNYKTLFVHLPTKGNQPIPSSPLISDPPTTRHKTKILPWQIEAFPLDPPNAIPFLCQCRNQQILIPGVILGSDLQYWITALQLAGSLATRQHYLPDLSFENGKYIARWKPVVLNEDRRQLIDLAQAMPSVCRALSQDSESHPQTPSEVILSQWIDMAVDGLVRTYSMEWNSTYLFNSKTRQLKFDSLHDQWLYALRSPNPELTGDPNELAELVKRVREWKKPIALTSDSPFRLCFRLEEPEEDSMVQKRKSANSHWKVRYLLEDVSDPSLLIEAKEVWNPKSRSAKYLQRPGFSPSEYLLFSLGQASGINSSIERSLEGPKPDGYETNEHGAFSFLNESALMLKDMGFSVILPSWWTGKGTNQRLSMRANFKSPAMQSDAGFSLSSILTFKWQTAIGDQDLTLEELKELAEMKVPLVKVRGQWMHINAEEIKAAVEFLKSKTSSSASLQEVVQMALGRANTPDGFDFAGVKADGWIGELLNRLEGKETFEEQQPYESFNGTLRPYQRRGYSWMSFLSQWGLGACLADDMGLGKTIQALALIQHDWHEQGKKPVLLVCPTSVVGNWQKEAERFTPELPVMIHHGSTRKKGNTFKKKALQQALVITSFALLHRDIEIFKELSWRAVILDEAQNIKNPQTKQAKAARTLQTDYRLALTGTPVENNIGDLWSILDFLNPGFLGSLKNFKENYFIPIQAWHDEDAINRLKRLTGPFILRRLKTEKSIISDLPDKMEMKVFCNLTKEQASLYSAVVDEAAKDLAQSEGIQRKGLVLSTLTRLKQVCNHPAHFLNDNSSILGRSGKLSRLLEMLEEIIEMNERALIFSQYTVMGSMLQQFLQEQFGRRVFFLHGGVPKKKRDAMIHYFQNEDHGPNIFVLSLKAGGTGLNLTRANHVFHFDRWWNPAVENQATDRVFRIGQTKNVQVHKFLCTGTLEERIDQLIEQKKELAEGIVGTGEAWLTELSTQELKDLFALDRNRAVV